MARINLLPWRNELRKKRQKEFAYLAVGAAVAMLTVIGGVHWFNEERIAFQKQRNEYLEQKTVELDARIKAIKNLDEQRKNLLARMEIIQQLQSSRPEIVHVFDELVRTLPEGVYYQKVKQSGNLLTVSGVAQSNAFVSSLMRNLNRSEWLEGATLKEIVADASNGSGNTELLRLANFGLEFKQVTLVSDENTDGDG